MALLMAFLLDEMGLCSVYGVNILDAHDNSVNIIFEKKIPACAGMTGDGS
jgi:4-diphosphocytidyl-2C-methyl-D-erythritol kinase